MSIDSTKYPGLEPSVIGVFDTYERRIAEQEQTIRELVAALTLFHDRQECPWCYDGGQCDVADAISKHARSRPEPGEALASSKDPGADTVPSQGGRD